jgi:hypothetical protein
MVRFARALSGLSVLSLSTLFLAAQPPIPTQELAFPQFVVGGGWTCELTLVAEGQAFSAGGVGFFDASGQGLAVKVNGAAPQNAFVYNLPRGTAANYELTKDGPTAVGFLLLSQAAVQGTSFGGVQGILTYRYKQNGKTTIQIGVPASVPLLGGYLPFDNTGGNRTSFAIISVNKRTVDASAYSENGTPLANPGSIRFSQVSQKAEFVDELFPELANKKGFLKLTSTDSFELLVLNQNGTILSTGAGLPEILEQTYTIYATDTTQWILRLLHTGNYLTGVAQRLGNSPILLYASGLLTEGNVQITIYATDPSNGNVVDICLLGPSDTNLTVAQGNVVIVGEDGGIIDSGTFSSVGGSGTKK